MPITVELGVDDPQYIYITAEWRYKELCKSIPGANYHAKTSQWRVPVSWTACLALRGTFRDELEIGPRLAQWAYEERAKRIEPGLALREIIASDEGDEDLFPHQRAGVNYLATVKRGLLTDEPGLGKSAQAIRALKEIERRGEPVFPALVVCPNTLKINWQREFERWWPGVRVQVIGGTAVQRRKQFDLYFKEDEEDLRPQVFVINWDTLRSHSRLAPYGSVALTKCVEHGGEDPKISATRCEIHPGELNLLDFKAVIADEIHRAKDPKSKQTRAFWAATGDADIRIGLTGTPVAKDVTDVWPLLHWLRPEEWPTRSRWIDRYVDVMENAFGGTHVVGLKPQMRDEFLMSINPVMRRMLKQVVLKFLPPVMVEERFVEMSPKQAKAYKQMQEDMIAELESGDVLLAPSPLTQMTRLLQMSVATVNTVGEDPVTGEPIFRLEEPSATLDAVMEDILSGDFGEDSIAISSSSKQLLDLLSARLTKAGLAHGMITGDISPDVRQKSIDEFQSGQIKYILFTVQAGGVGVTLTKARRLLRLLRPWSLVDDIQANDRVHRIGSEIHDSIVITDYIVTNTVQERVQDVLNSKGLQAEQVMNDRAFILKTMKGE